MGSSSKPDNGNDNYITTSKYLHNLMNRCIRDPYSGVRGAPCCLPVAGPGHISKIDYTKI
jgi:hypothetical protein